MRTFRGYEMTITTRFRDQVTRLALAFVMAAGVAQVLLANQDSPEAARLFNRAKLLSARACDSCDLAGVDLARQNLKGVSAAQANLEGASFYRADLGGANFGGANLSKANLTMADLSNTNFGNANLAGANLSGSTGAALAGATTTETTTCPDGTAGPCR
jgi:uncharacterized protein YjbI with pentapeptide repeats